MVEDLKAFSSVTIKGRYLGFQVTIPFDLLNWFLNYYLYIIDVVSIIIKIIIIVYCTLGCTAGASPHNNSFSVQRVPYADWQNGKFYHHNGKHVCTCMSL